MGDVGGGASQSDTAFKRQGTSQLQTSHTLPSFLSNLIQSNSSSAEVSSNLAGGQENFLTGLLGRNDQGQPGMDTLNTITHDDPQGFQGFQTLTNLANRDPYSTTYADQTSARFDDTVGQAVAASQSGAARVRGGQDHSAIAAGEATERAALDRFKEVSAVQRADAEVTERASQILNQIEQGRKALAVGAQGTWVKQILDGAMQKIGASGQVDTRRGINAANLTMAAEMLGGRNSLNTEDLQGSGSQSSETAHANMGLTCCFIFLEALNGQLPWYVRRGRDIFVNDRRRDGYNRMGRTLIPAMRKWPAVKAAVNAVLIKPFLKWGAWYFGELPKTSKWRFLKPYIFGWFKVWDFLGGKA